MATQAQRSAIPMRPKLARRVVTGHDATGKAVVIADGPSEDCVIRADRGVAITDIWQLSAVPADLHAWERRDRDTPMAIAPVAGGLNLRVLQFDPLPAGAAADGAAAFADMGSADAHVANARHPAMHRTDTVDFAIVISGSITLLLDEDDVTISASDVVIQRGTAHAWENRGDVPCLVAVIVVDAGKCPPVAVADPRGGPARPPGS
jgi:mannose-6-phosphate isomerase-like protein (cupin superfamily)